MEKQLFDWEECDFVDKLIYIYYKVTRKSDGKKFDIANLNYEEGTLEYCDAKSNVLETHKLILTSEEMKVGFG